MTSRAAYTALGILMIAAGLLWAAQGAGLLAWPAVSPMLGRPPWIWVGLGLALCGAALVLGSRRRR